MALATSAKEIRRQSVRIKEQIDKFMRYDGKMHGDLQEISARISPTEDSSLHQKLVQLSTIYNMFYTEIRDSYNELAAAMERYADRTIENEEQEQGQVEETGDALQDIINMLSSK